MNRAAFQRAMRTALFNHLETGQAMRLPAGGELVWRWFRDLSAARGQGFAGPLPITWKEIDAYRRLSGEPIEPGHVKLILTLDRCFIEFHAAAAGEVGPSLQPMAKGRDRGNLSAQAFDAMFG